MASSRVPLPARKERKLSLFVIGGAIFVTAVSIFRLWEMSMEWRVENVPALSTQLERDRVALMRDFERVQMALRATTK